MRSLQDRLVTDSGFDLTGWRLFEAMGISADATTMVGYGFNPDGFTETWIAHLPEPATALLFHPRCPAHNEAAKVGGWRPAAPCAFLL